MVPDGSQCTISGPGKCFESLFHLGVEGAIRHSYNQAIVQSVNSAGNAITSGGNLFLMQVTNL